MREPRSLPSLTCTRRDLVLGALALPLLHALPAQARDVSELARLERRQGGRLGVVVLDTTGAILLSHRADERFALCSTFKVLLAGFVLARVDRGEEQLDRALPIVEADLILNSPVTHPLAGGSLSLEALCEAAVTTSDNTAANLLLGATGGPAALTAFLRDLGDPVTQIDRIEPALNAVDLAAGDTRDTTSPAAMARTVGALVHGEVLRPESRARLTGWLRAAVTGTSRLRAGLPADWNPGDKTGTGMDGPTNDVAVAWPPGRAPLVVAAYYDRPGRTMQDNSAVLAQVGHLVSEALRPAG